MAAGLISRLATRAIAEERGATQQGNMELGAPPLAYKSSHTGFSGE